MPLSSLKQNNFSHFPQFLYATIRNRFATPITTLILASILVSVNYLLANIIKLYGLSAYVVPSAIWLLVFLVLFRYEWRIAAFTSKLTTLLPLLIVIRVAGEFVLGVFTGFGKNANLLVPASLGFTLLHTAPVVLGVEMFRLALVRRVRSRYLFVLIAFMMTFITLPLSRFVREDLSSLLTSLSSVVIPRIIENLFLCQLALAGGSKPLVGYVAMVTYFELLSPVLPTGNIYVLSLGRTAILLLQLVALEVLLGFGEMHKLSRSELLSSLAVTLLATSIAFSMFLGFRVMTVVSGSMRPSIEVGDLVVVKNVNTSDLRVGDVIAYVKGKTIVLHRIVMLTSVRGETAFITKGDANTAVDPNPILPEQIVGRLVYVVPRIGYPLVLIAQYEQSYINAVVTAILFIVLVYYILSIRVLS
ncbi:MAG: signal peptidase I [Thermoprotei archaeon]|nr:MAG: signal peptidase I [Thermoprotei archaeon]